MQFDDLKNAMIEELPVEYGGVKYKCITGIIYRKNIRKKGRIGIQVELMSTQRNSVVIVDLQKVILVKTD